MRRVRCCRAGLAIEYRERQHSEPVAVMDGRDTVSGVIAENSVIFMMSAATAGPNLDHGRMYVRARSARQDLFSVAFVPVGHSLTMNGRPMDSMIFSCARAGMLLR